MSSCSARSALSALLRRQLAAPKSAPARRWLSAPARSLRTARPTALRFASTLRDPDPSDPGIQVSEVQDSTGAPETPEQVAARTVFIGRISFNVDHAWLREEFESAGEITSARIITDRDGGSRGFGYIEFKDAASAQKAIEYDGKEIDGRAVRVDQAQPQQPRGQRYPGREARAGGSAYDNGRKRPAVALPPSSTLYLGNVSFNATESQLRDVFAPDGPDDAPIVSIRIPVDSMNGRPRGFAYIEYGDTATAERVLARFQAKPQPLDGRELRVGYSTPRNQFAQRRDGAGDSAPYGSRGGPAIARGGYGRRDDRQGGSSYGSQGGSYGRRN